MIDAAHILAALPTVHLSKIGQANQATRPRPKGQGGQLYNKFQACQGHQATFPTPSHYLILPSACFTADHAGGVKLIATRTWARRHSILSRLSWMSRSAIVDQDRRHATVQIEGTGCSSDIGPTPWDNPGSQSKNRALIGMDRPRQWPTPNWATYLPSPRGVRGSPPNSARTRTGHRPLPSTKPR